MYTALPVKQEYKTFMVKLLVAKDLKSSSTGFTSIHNNTYLFMFPFNGVNMCIMFHTYHGLQNFFTYHENFPLGPEGNNVYVCTQKSSLKNTYREKFLTPIHGQSLHHHVMDLGIFYTVGTNGSKCNDLQLK
jgi:hypothetical protein